MPIFVPTVTTPTPGQMLSLAVAANAALRGETANTGTSTLAAGESTLTITDSRCRYGRLAWLIPMNAAASGLSWYLSAMTQGGMSFAFASAPAEDAQFGWVIVGATLDA